MESHPPNCGRSAASQSPLPGVPRQRRVYRVRRRSLYGLRLYGQMPLQTGQAEVTAIQIAVAAVLAILRAAGMDTGIARMYGATTTNWIIPLPGYQPPEEQETKDEPSTD